MTATPRQFVLMKCPGGRDCAVAAVGTACNVSYAEAATALNHVDLPGPLESPILSNPWNLYRALVRLGFWKRNITLQMLLKGDCKPGETIVLVKGSQLEQHWVVWMGCHAEGWHLFYWGDNDRLRLYNNESVKKLFLTAWPNCAFQVYKASVWRVWWERFKEKLTSWRR